MRRRAGLVEVLRQTEELLAETVERYSSLGFGLFALIVVGRWIWKIVNTLQFERDRSANVSTEADEGRRIAEGRLLEAQQRIFELEQQIEELRRKPPRSRPPGR